MNNELVKRVRKLASAIEDGRELDIWDASTATEAAASLEAAPPAPAAPAEAQGAVAVEPVAWQYRVKHDTEDRWLKWHLTTKDHFDRLNEEQKSHVETRPLYARPIRTRAKGDRRRKGDGRGLAGSIPGGHGR